MRLIILSAFCLLVPLSRAAVLVYEGFNYALANETTLNGVAVTATGLTGSYGIIKSSSADNRFLTTGLTFSPSFYPTSGGSARLIAATGQYAGIGARLNAGTVTGDLYHSFLLRTIELTGTGADNGSHTRIGNSATSPSGNRLAVAPESKNAGAGPGVGYDGTEGTVQAAGGALTLNTTYLMLAKFTNVGTALSAGSPGVATFWALTESGYDNWLTLGGKLEANLGTYAAFTATDTQTSGTYAFDNTDYMQLGVTTTGTGGGRIDMYMDEIRYGTTLESVANNYIIPEPSTLVLLMSGALLVGFRRWKMKGAS
jgi:hypothetical protein